MSADAEYWTAEHVERGGWIVLSSWRVARLYGQLALEGGESRSIFVSSEGRLLCQHGELASSIHTWLYGEKRARANGREPAARDGACDCQSVDGLGAKVCNADELLTDAPGSLVECCKRLRTETVDTRKGGMWHVPGSNNTYVSQTEQGYFCRHGTNIRSLERGKGCGCVSSKPPSRRGRQATGGQKRRVVHMVLCPVPVGHGGGGGEPRESSE